MSGLPYSVDCFRDDGTRGAEQIVAAAVQDGDHIWTLPAPARHGDVVSDMHYRRIDPAHTYEQGFVTSRMRYVTRWQALRIAVEAGQCARSLLRRADGELYSEDVW